MKYHQLFIHFENNPETLAAVTTLMGVEPMPNSPSVVSPDVHDTWWYMVSTDEAAESFDFINVFLDLLEDKYEALAALGIQRTDIQFWLVYEYTHQCAMEFRPQAMQRLGASGIALNIDCYEVKEAKS